MTKDAGYSSGGRVGRASNETLLQTAVSLRDRTEKFYKAQDGKGSRKALEQLDFNRGKLGSVERELKRRGVDSSSLMNPTQGRRAHDALGYLREQVNQGKFNKVGQVDVYRSKRNGVIVSAMVDGKPVAFKYRDTAYKAKRMFNGEVIEDRLIKSSLQSASKADIKGAKKITTLNGLGDGQKLQKHIVPTKIENLFNHVTLAQKKTIAKRAASDAFFEGGYKARAKGRHDAMAANLDGFVNHTVTKLRRNMGEKWSKSKTFLEAVNMIPDQRFEKAFADKFNLQYMSPGDLSRARAGLSGHIQKTQPDQRGSKMSKTFDAWSKTSEFKTMFKGFEGTKYQQDTVRKERKKLNKGQFINFATAKYKTPAFDRLANSMERKANRAIKSVQGKTDKRSLAIRSAAETFKLQSDIYKSLPRKSGYRAAKRKSNKNLFMNLVTAQVRSPKHDKAAMKMLNKANETIKNYKSKGYSKRNQSILDMSETMKLNAQMYLSLPGVTS